MKPLRLRILKRHSSVEDASEFETFFEVEFQRNGAPDLDLSVFEIDAACLVRTHAECVVSWLDPPIKKRGGLAVEDCPGEHTPNRTIAATEFAYTRDHHLELGFLDEAELRAFAKDAFDSCAGRERAATREEVRNYGGARLGAGDPEWASATGKRPKWKKELERAIKAP